MAVPVPSFSCCVLNHHNLFYQISNALAFNRDTCCHLALCLWLLPFHCSFLQFYLQNFYFVYLFKADLCGISLELSKVCCFIVMLKGFRWNTCRWSDCRQNDMLSNMDNMQNFAKNVDLKCIFGLDNVLEKRIFWTKLHHDLQKKQFFSDQASKSKNVLW